MWFIGGDWILQWTHSLQGATRSCYVFKPNVTMTIGLDDQFTLSLRIPKNSISLNNGIHNHAWRFLILFNRWQCPVLIYTGRFLVLSPNDLGWYVYFHEAQVKVTSLDRTNYIPSTYFAAGAISSAESPLEFLPKQTQFLNREMLPCNDEHDYIFGRASKPPGLTLCFE